MNVQIHINVQKSYKYIINYVCTRKVCLNVDIFCLMHYGCIFICMISIVFFFLYETFFSILNINLNCLL